MNVPTLLIWLIAIDVLLCVAVIFLLIQGMFPKKKSVFPEGITDANLQQLQEMLFRSQEDLQVFQDSIREGQKSFEALIRQAEEREKSMKMLLEEVRQEASRPQKQGFAGDLEETQRYKDAALLIHQGKTDQEIIRECHITEGELVLIKGLLGIRNESV